MNKPKLAYSVLAFLFFFVPQFPVSAETLKEVIEGAKKEGQVRAYTSMQRRTAAVIIKEYRKKYPFIKKVDHHRFSGLEESERVLAEMKAGRIDMDVLLVRSELWERHRPFLTGPINWKSLGIGKDRTAKGGFEIIWAGSSLKGILYNEELVPKDRIPTKWEDCVDPFWSENFIVSARPIFMMQLMPAWGEEKVLAFARRLAANKPIWIRSQTTGAQAVAAGQFPLFCGGDHVRWFRLHSKGASIQLVNPDPIPTSEGRGVSLLKAAKYPNAAKLFMAFMASDETQLLLDKLEGRGHKSVPGTLAHKLTKGKRISLYTDEWDIRGDELSKQVVEAWGFPVAR